RPDRPEGLGRDCRRLVADDPAHGSQRRCRARQCRHPHEGRGRAGTDRHRADRREPDERARRARRQVEGTKPEMSADRRVTLTEHAANVRDLFTPKLVTVLREGYGRAALRDDALAGLTVAIVALPLSMAIAIAS